MGQITVLKRSLKRMSIESPKHKNEKNGNPEVGAKMVTTRNKKIRFSFHSPSTYPLPKGLLIGFWGK